MKLPLPSAPGEENDELAGAWSAAWACENKREEGEAPCAWWRRVDDDDLWAVVNRWDKPVRLGWYNAVVMVEPEGWYLIFLCLSRFSLYCLHRVTIHIACPQTFAGCLLAFVFV